jgi:tRNA G18 (ribose-2'-O)-methylase SpoU
MNLIPIHSVDDPRIALFREIKESELLNVHGLFVAEGEHLVHRLLASRFEIHSLLLEESSIPKFSAEVSDLPAPLYVVDKQLIRQIAGYDFNRGALALAVRRPLQRPDQLTLPQTGKAVVVICPEINDAENLGAILRTAAAFDVRAVILGERCRDPFYRRTLRVSMGAALSLNLVQSDHLRQDLQRWHDDHQLALFATALHQATRSLEDFTPPRCFGLLFGSESQGLSPEWLDLCDERLTLPMANHTDSLNVAVAAGIFLYHCTQTSVSGSSAGTATRPA